MNLSTTELATIEKLRSGLRQAKGYIDERLVTGEQVKKVKQVEDHFCRAFMRRYKCDPGIRVSRSTNCCIREFKKGSKIAEVVEFRVDGDTDKCIVYLGQDRKLYTYSSYLEAEISIVDYLTEDR